MSTDYERFFRIGWQKQSNIRYIIRNIEWSVERIRWSENVERSNIDAFFVVSSTLEIFKLFSFFLYFFQTFHDIVIDLVGVHLQVEVTEVQE